jgi:selenocysteine lyase/cysteine desulfurase
MYLRRNAAEIPGVRVNTPLDPAMSAGISSIGIDKVPGRRLAEYLRQRYDTYVPGGGGSIRFSTHYYNTFEQVDRVLEALRHLAKEA